MFLLKNLRVLCKHIVEIDAVVDVGTPEISTSYLCESKQPMIFVVGECIAKMNTMYEQGVGYMIVLS